MKKRYNLALIPLTKANDIIKIAAAFSAFSYQYCLGECSLPHVTLYHFDYDETEIADLWEKALMVFPSEKILLTFSSLSVTNNIKQIYWLALMPNQRPQLQVLHQIIADLLSLPVKATFDPHMTLLNSQSSQQLKEAIQKIEKNYQPIIDNFVLALGKSDPVGQLTEIIFNQ
jgi:2'-5' RNA ligase